VQPPKKHTKRAFKRFPAIYSAKNGLANNLAKKKVTEPHKKSALKTPPKNLAAGIKKTQKTARKARITKYLKVTNYSEL